MEGRYDNLDTIPEDEPVFVIRAQDVCAYSTVKHWIKMARLNGVDDAMIKEAELHADRIARWPIKKVPDMA